MRYPLPGRISAGYGDSSDFRKSKGLQPHSGTDWPAPLGTKFRAIGNGTIKLIQESKILGWVTVQSVWDGKRTWYVGYCHQDSRPALAIGDKVTEGQVIGSVGNRGLSSGPHLHLTVSRKLKGVFGVWTDKVDPVKFIQGNKSPSGSTGSTGSETQGKTSITCAKCGTEYHAKL